MPILMKINKDLIISDTTTSLGDVADNISTINSNLSELNKMKSRRLVWSGTGSSGTNLTLNDGLKWSDLGRFKTLIVIVVYAPTNVTTSAIIPYDQMCNMSSTNLNENKRNTNCESPIWVDRASNIHLIPTGYIGENWIKFNIQNAPGTCSIQAIWVEY